MYHFMDWLDTESKPIQAHGGSVLYREVEYYWYGENKEKTTGETKIWHWGVRCCKSADLCNRTDCGLIISPEPNSPYSPENTSIARYVWLPLRFEGEMAYIDRQDSWNPRDCL